MFKNKSTVMIGVCCVSLLTAVGCGNVNTTTPPPAMNNTTNSSTNSTSNNSTNSTANSSTNTTTNSTTNGTTNSSTPGTSQGTSTGTSTTNGTTNNQTGTIVGDTKIIQLTSPTANQTVKAGTSIPVAGTVASEFKNQTIQFTLFSGTHKVSQEILVQKFQVNSNGAFSGALTIPDSLPASGTQMQLLVELLVKGAPQIQTTLVAN